MGSQRSRRPGGPLRRALVVLLVALGTSGCALLVVGEILRQTAQEFQLDEGELLTTYAITDDGELADPVREPVDDEDLARLRDDRDAHVEAWRLWRDIAPEPWRSRIVEVHVLTDGRDGGLAAVFTEEDGGWVLEIDPADLADREELEHTLVHELAHVFSLDTDQLVAGTHAFEDLEDATAGCAPATGVEEGCLVGDAYLARFVDRFWTAQELEAASGVLLADDPDAATAELFERDPDRYPTEYAASHPAEDFAESWATYVLYEWEREDPDAVWVRKAAFFGDFPELVAARRHIWDALGIEG